MNEMVERVASSMYWDRVNPDKGPVGLSVLVRNWDELPDEHRGGIQVWHCKAFWRDAARAGIREMRESSEAMKKCGWDVEASDGGCVGYLTAGELWRAMIDIALKD